MKSSSRLRLTSARLRQPLFAWRSAVLRFLVACAFALAFWRAMLCSRVAPWHVALAAAVCFGTTTRSPDLPRAKRDFVFFALLGMVTNTQDISRVS